MDNPSPEQIKDWKFEYGPIFQVQGCIFRGVTIGEADRIFNSSLTSVEIEEELFHSALLWSREDIDIDKKPAGFVSAVADNIRDISGYGDPKTIIESLNKIRVQRAQKVSTLAKALILAAMPSYTDDDLNKLTFTVLLEKVALAEEILKIHQSVLAGVDTMLDILDPEEEAKKHQRAAEHHNASRKPGQPIYGDPIAEKLRNSLG